MNMRLLGCLLGLLIGVVALGDKLTLKSGAVLEGTILQRADGSYWVKTYDGASQTVPSDEVKSLEKSDGPSTSGTASSAAGTAKPAGSFAATKAKADAADAAVSAVAIWQQFVDASAADSPDLAAAQDELTKWKKMAEDGAERVNGKWIAGEERKALVAKVNTMLLEARELWEKDQTINAVAKLQAVVKIYPNSFEGNAVLGMLSIKMDKPDDALRYFRQALKLQPQAAACMSGMGLAYFRQKQWASAISCFHKAVVLEDSEDTVQSLIAGVTRVPPPFVRDAGGKKAMEAARLLEGKYKIRAENNVPIFVIPRYTAKSSGLPATASANWSGTGFLISSDGLILTNRHVAKGAANLLVMLSDKSTRSATVVAIDDAQDLALIRITSRTKLPYVLLCPTDSPRDGADCTVLGFPLLDRLGLAVKVTKGIVTTGNREDPLADVVIDAKVNPGNSGGPILDKFGRVMAIVSMKSLSTAMEDSYGLGISTGRIRKFLAKNNIKLDAVPDTAGAALSTEDVAALAKPATVCILATTEGGPKN